MQALVRIYKRGAPLTGMQDIDFSIYGFLSNSSKAGG
jgi:hypothetical protein